MLRQVVASNIAKPITPVVSRLAGVRLYTKDHLKKDQDQYEKQEQKMFDKNKKDLEQFEHGNKKSRDYKAEDLQEKGENARVEQNRPDDGVY
ncbi:hypothetical protein RNJ44_03724 [Nakaseomyces bracarensis]|uniref:Uncharacterized protein n=1 Tax=Nakaseomyces bracarensis TaxID=273131 RepID=A0ABR4NXU9_9SACH